jgi:hypothetical protein
MVGKRPFSQLELFHHGNPAQQPLPEDWRPCDHGWVRFGIAVDNFDQVMSGLARRSIPILGTAGATGQSAAGAPFWKLFCPSEAV